ncbi:MAG: 30S ribosomal protein S20 [Candidatus Omnitrophica bacterium]|nr:30S ribosomal protein S20 [Candidatus Omnitrophota bacterium]MBI2495376.1 30S ribosomal protein S20 [Candidatus Omnitrophota bacterium]MBI3021285.1 30S ribosomal protein S20 [Candidatus Omnitrophota bacterium]MBI3083582.1 30S ribosomal protein S20 [Candidatus Omnitrophota bacterium]
MPIKHAALKQIRKDRKRQERNQAVRSELKTLTKGLRALLSAQKLEEAKMLLQQLAKQYDHAVSKGIIHRNTASRHKSRLMRRLHQAATRSP